MSGNTLIKTTVMKCSARFVVSNLPVIEILVQCLTTCTYAQRETSRDSQQAVSHHIICYTVDTRRCDYTRAEKISLVITTMVTGDMLPLSFVEAGGFCELMAFVNQG